MYKRQSLILCALSGLVIAVLCFFLAAPMLELLRTKDDLLPGAVLYFRIYALGMPALGIFNFGNAVLSASGDTKRPLAYLTAAGILNVILNLFFVIAVSYTHLGTFSSAAAPAFPRSARPAPQRLRR